MKGYSISIKAAIYTLDIILGDQLSLSTSDLAVHSQYQTHLNPTLPNAVTFLHNTDEISKIVETCAQYHCPVSGYCVGKLLEGNTLAT
jgi:D-lactate dehydrogenase (cytochrome)